MSAQARRRATRRTIVFVRTEFLTDNQSIASAPPAIDAGGDCEFTCAQCGKVLLIGDTSHLDNIVFQCQACDAFNALAPNPAGN